MALYQRREDFLRGSTELETTEHANGHEGWAGGDMMRRKIQTEAREVTCIRVNHDVGKRWVLQ